MKKIKKIIEMIIESKEKRWDGQLLRSAVRIIVIWIAAFIAIPTDNLLLDGLLYGICLMSIICGAVDIIISNHNFKVAREKYRKEFFKLLDDAIGEVERLKQAESTTTKPEEKEV